MPGRSGYQPRSKAWFVQRLQALGFAIEQQHETIASLLGVVTAQIEEIDEIKKRLDILENRQPSSFVGS